METMTPLPPVSINARRKSCTVASRCASVSLRIPHRALLSLTRNFVARFLNATGRRCLGVFCACSCTTTCAYAPVVLRWDSTVALLCCTAFRPSKCHKRPSALRCSRLSGHLDPASRSRCNLADTVSGAPSAPTSMSVMVPRARRGHRPKRKQRARSAWSSPPHPKTG